MSKVYLIYGYLIIILVLCGCSINISQPLPSTVSVPNSEPENSSGTNTQIPVPWSDLKLSGKLVYISSEVGSSSKRLSLKMSILSRDLKTGEFTTVFRAPDGAWIGYANVSPDNEQLIMSYSLPQNDTASTSFKLQVLYTMPLDGSNPPQLLFAPPSDKDEYYQPEWSPDGQYIYFTHANYQSATTYEIMRMAYPNGKPEQVVDQAYWPRLSRDGDRLVYVSIDPETGKNKLFVAKSDGAQASPIPLLGTSWTSTFIDTPMFSPDNQTILFSGPSQQQSSSLNWIEKLTGVRVALAHASIPSDWWSVPLTGGEPAQLTHIYSLGLFGSLSPDMKYVASYSVDGIFVMQPDGKSLTKVVSTTGSTSGTVSWIR